jgi:F-type H+-transporting ATPase subunit delta
VSSGFAFVHADSSTDIVAVEAFPLEQLDPEAVKKVSQHDAPDTAGTAAQPAQLA